MLAKIVWSSANFGQLEVLYFSVLSIFLVSLVARLRCFAMFSKFFATRALRGLSKEESSSGSLCDGLLPIPSVAEDQGHGRATPELRFSTAFCFQRAQIRPASEPGSAVPWRFARIEPSLAIGPWLPYLTVEVWACSYPLALHALCALQVMHMMPPLGASSRLDSIALAPPLLGPFVAHPPQPYRPRCHRGRKVGRDVVQQASWGNCRSDAPGCPKSGQVWPSFG